MKRPLKKVDAPICSIRDKALKDFVVSKWHEINGLEASSSLLFIANHFDSGLVILPSTLDLRKAAETLKFFSSGKAQIEYYPSFERLFDPIRQEMSLVAQRIELQTRVAEGLSPKTILLTNLEALSQKSVRGEKLRRAAIEFKKSQWIERNSLLLKLAALGYRRDELAEDRGFFAVRGHLVDVFSPYQPNPVRIEFFGDEIVSMRAFDPTTQRSLDELETFVLLPTREIVTSEEKFASAKEKIKNFADERGIPREERERLLFDLDHQRDVVEPRWLLPAFEDNLQSLLSALPEAWPLIWIDRAQGIEALHQSWEQEDRAFAELKRLAFPPETLRDPLDTLLSQKGHELETRISGRGLTYQVMGHGDLRDRLVESKSFRPLASLVADFHEKNIQTTFVISSSKRREALVEAMGEQARHVEWIEGPAFDGFSSLTFRRAFVTERDIFGVKRKRSSYSVRTKEDFLRQFSDLQSGDFVIHEDHGIARFRGLEAIAINGGKTEFLVLEYAEKDKLFLPVYRLDKLSRYVSDGYAEPRLDRLGSQAFAKRKLRIREDILQIAHELLNIAAQRKLSKVSRAASLDRTAYFAFCQAFPYDLTSDQEAAIQDIESDLASDIPMDRLVCGDVGFGKTEVALRAAMLTLLRGYQVAVLAPTTILVEQHFQNFRRRFSQSPFRIAHLSRFVSASEQKSILKEVEAGKIDLVIGTHRLLGTDVKFKNLQLLIVDEEQRFGVKHKEKIKKLRADLDVLTLTATPIPRTLQMSVAGIRELSLVTTPPENREAVKTFVASFEPGLIKSVIRRELDRGGQVLFVHNRVQTIDALYNKLREWMPDVKVTVAHGQMPEGQLEEKMLEFIEGRSSVLLATSIIENGLDIPNANTLLVDHAETFGLSNLYQLRGRVGRSHVQAYAYFLVHETTQLTAEASKRLQVIQSCTDLGSGFNIATHDLEIRGSGNILGEEQSGVIAEVGLELYTQMLQETLAELRNHQPLEPLPELNSGYTAYIPESYIPDPAIRIATYKQLNNIHHPRELLALEEELLDRFGLYPKELENFCQLIGLRTLAHALRAEAIDIFPGRLAITLSPRTPLDPQKVIPLVGKGVSLDPKGRLTFEFEKSTAQEAEKIDFQTCRRFLRDLCEKAGVTIQDQ